VFHLINSNGASPLQTPNFALRTDDIPLAARGPSSPEMRITRQVIRPQKGLGQVGDVDVILNSHQHLPPPIILDYSYGVAAYNQWQSHASEQFRDYMALRSTELYRNLPPRPVLPQDSQDSGEEDETPDRTSPAMLEAMDRQSLLGMTMSGITPEMYAERRRKQEEEEELRTQEASRGRVQQWLKR
jgi:hypothetical protein